MDICKCGCKKEFEKYDSRGRSRKYLYGHNRKNITPWNKGLDWQPSSAFKKGVMSSAKPFIKGQTAWNKGMVGFMAGEQSFSWKGGKPKCVTCNKQLTGYGRKWCIKHSPRKGNPASPEQWKKLQMKGLLKQQNMKEPTSIEKKVYDYLLLKGVLFEKQRLINDKFVVDAYIPSLNMIIEADGSYWHSLDRVVKRDRAKNAYLTKCGFNLLRLGEDEIRNDSFISRLERVVD